VEGKKKEQREGGEGRRGGNQECLFFVDLGVLHKGYIAQNAVEWIADLVAEELELL